jgi:hypothetical protein
MFEHGLSIGISRVDNEFYLTMKAIGTLTHEDYEKITPMIDGALEGVKDAKVRVYIDGTELDGWEARALWDDFKIALKHGNEFEKIAIHGNKKWQEFAVKLGGWFISGKAKYFEDAKDAYDWLRE